MTDDSCCVKNGNAERGMNKINGFDKKQFFQSIFLNINIQLNLIGSKAFDAECGIQYNTYIAAGNDLWVGNTELREDCARFCYFANGCKGWTWYKGECWAKSDASSTVIDIKKVF